MPGGTRGLRDAVRVGHARPVPRVRRHADALVRVHVGRAARVPLLPLRCEAPRRVKSSKGLVWGFSLKSLTRRPSSSPVRAASCAILSRSIT